MKTISTTSVETSTVSSVLIGGNEVAAEWRDGAPVVDRHALRCIRDAGGANWSNDEIETLAIHAEGLLVDAFCKTYRVAFTREDGGFDVVDTFAALDDDAANAYAATNFAGSDWYVLNAAGENING